MHVQIVLSKFVSVMMIVYNCNKLADIFLVLGEGTLFIAILSPRNQGHFKKTKPLLHFNF
jgi:hypothetical protein